MRTEFFIKSHDRDRLAQARRVAREFAQQYAGDGVAGIVFLGAVARGYYDEESDIDIALFMRPPDRPRPPRFSRVEGLEVHCWLSDLAGERGARWSMARRWTFAQGEVFFDPDGDVARLLAEKVPLRPEERRELLISGLALSEWYINRLAGAWVRRGSVASAHQMFGPGLDRFYEMLFALNSELVPDAKWRGYCAGRLAVLPARFEQGIAETMTLHSLTVEEIARRQAAFMRLWQDIRPRVEAAAGMTFDEMKEIV